MPKLMHCFTLQREAKWSLCEDETLMQQAHHLPLHVKPACPLTCLSPLCSVDAALGAGDVLTS